MGSPKNIQRDGIWIEPEGTAIAWSTAFSVSGAAIYNSSAVVFTDQASVASTSGAVTTTVNQMVAVGINISKIGTDNIPYRVKASVAAFGASSNDVNALIIVGYAIASPTGSDDIINNPYFIPFQGSIDELILVPPPISGALADRALVIALAVTGDSGLSSKPVLGALSVQNLGVKPPTMQNAVS